MMMFIWFWVVTQAFFPGGERVASLQTNAVQAHIRTSVERPIMTLGWVSRDDVEAIVPAPAPGPDVRDRIRAAQAALEALPVQTATRKPRRRAVAAA